MVFTTQHIICVSDYFRADILHLQMELSYFLAFLCYHFGGDLKIWRHLFSRYKLASSSINSINSKGPDAGYLKRAPNSIQIPRQISREELLRRLPESWITSYEKLHQATQSPIQSSELFAQFAIQIDERSFYGPAKEQNPKPSSFEKDGTVIYPFKDKDGHCYFDVCSCAACNEASYESDEDIRIRRRKEKDPLYKRYLEGDTSVGPLGERKYNFIVQYSDKKEEPRQQIMMINPDEFPPQEDFLKNNISHCPKILSQAVDSFGPNQLSQAEKVLANREFTCAKSTFVNNKS
ncbi:hypothetical protein F2Q68_00034704 [Brassica cretica]|uniref:Uncharacterized protein n=1 Tax=Brassica cretica TaxID=69181 RepID=A0A8S9H6T4_BRACR|nr:hypothetical protein F2Q68_00034704 [Brassica cretica]